MVDSIAKFSMRHRKFVVLMWVGFIALYLLSASAINTRFTTSLAIPNTESAKAEQILNSKFHEKTEGLITIIYRFGNKSPAEIQSLKQSISTAAEVVPFSHIAQQQAIAGTLFTIVATNSELSVASHSITNLRKSLRVAGLQGALVSGPPAIYKDVRPVLALDLRHGEIIALISALIFLVIALGLSWSIFIPIFFAASTISLTLILINVISHFTSMVLYTSNIVELIGFGLAVDYSLLMLHRYREESQVNSETSHEQITSSVITSTGKTIAVSASIVALTISSLIFFPIPFIQSLGIAGVLVPLISLLAGLTLMPALLAMAGSRVMKTFKFSGLISKSEYESGFLHRITQLTIRRPRLIFISSLLLLAGLAFPALSLDSTPSSLTAIPRNLESSKALNYITAKVGDGIITPVVVIADLRSKGAASQTRVLRDQLFRSIGRDPEVLTVASGNQKPFIDASGRFVRIFIFGKNSLGTEQNRDLVKKLRVKILPNSDLAHYAKFYVGGAPAEGLDLIAQISRSAPLIFGTALLLIFLLLMTFFQSVVIPLKAIVLDLISLSAAFGILVIFFKMGIGEKLFNTYHLPQIEIWVIIFLIVILFGISMDYEIFIVSRIREAWDSGDSNSKAVEIGFSRTIRVVTSAGIIFIAAVSGFISGHFAGLQELGVGLAAAVLVDVTVIRLFLLPSAMILFGNLNWWIPNRKSRHQIR